MQVKVKSGSGMEFAKLASSLVRFGRSADALENEAWVFDQFHDMPRHIALIGVVETFGRDEHEGHETERNASKTSPQSGNPDGSCSKSLGNAVAGAKSRMTKSSVLSPDSKNWGFFHHC